MHAATLGVALVLGLAACAPKARPLTGAPTRAALPTFAVDPRPHVLEFTWEYKDETFEAAGEGAVRVQGPIGRDSTSFCAMAWRGGTPFSLATRSAPLVGIS